MVVIDGGTSLERLAVERFEYSHGRDDWGDRAVLRLLAGLGPDPAAPTAAHLVVRPEPALGDLVYGAAYGCSVERRLVSAGRADFQYLWSATFSLPLEVVEAPEALFQLIAGDGLAVALALPRPVWHDADSHALSLNELRRRHQRSARERTVLSARQLAALATSVAVTVTSVPAAALAARGGNQGVGASLSMGRRAAHVRAHPRRPSWVAASAAARAAGSATASATATATTPVVAPPATPAVAPPATPVATPAATPGATTAPVAAPPTTTTTTTTTVAPASTTPVAAPKHAASKHAASKHAASKHAGSKAGAVKPGGSHKPHQRKLSLGHQPGTRPTATECKDSTGPLAYIATVAGHRAHLNCPAPATPPAAAHPHAPAHRAQPTQGATLTFGGAPAAGRHHAGKPHQPKPAHHPAPRKPVHVPAPRPILPPATLPAPIPAAPSSGTVPVLSPSSFGAPKSWTGDVAADPGLTGAVTELRGLLSNGDRPPSFLIPIYMEAGQRYHVPWQVLAAINAIETDYGTNLNTSSAGAIGWMQFEPSTWAHYGMAVDGHSEPNPYDPRDAVFSAARYLAAAGAAQDVSRAVYAYNHASWYVDEVMARAKAIATHVQYERANFRHGVFTLDFATGQKSAPRVSYSSGVLSHYDRLIAAANMVSAANFPYLWGGGHTQPARWGAFDCSGSVSYVMQQAGYDVPTTVSGDIPSWKLPAGPGRVTIFYNPTHTFMRIGNRFFGTSDARPGGGAGWSPYSQLPAGYLAGFKEVHVPGLGPDSFSTSDPAPIVTPLKPLHVRSHHRTSTRPVRWWPVLSTIGSFPASS